MSGQRRTVGRPPRGECDRQRLALLELLDESRGAGAPLVAWDHLNRCHGCRTEFEQLVLMGASVRRARAADPAARLGADAWLRLRARVIRPPDGRSGRAASPALGAALAAGIAIAMLAPLGFVTDGRRAVHEAGVDPVAIRAAGRRDADDEARQLRATLIAARLAASRDGASQARLQRIRSETQAGAGRPAPTRRPLSASAK